MCYKLDGEKCLSFFCMLIMANRCTFTFLFFKVTLFSFAQQPIVMISAKKSLGTSYLWFCRSRVMDKNIFIFPFLCTFWAKYVAKYERILEIIGLTCS